MVNKWIGIGNIGRDPEVRYTQNGKAVAKLSLACTEKRKGQDGQYHDHTEWVNVVSWGRLAEICGEYLAKGSKVYIEGKLQTCAWEDQGGNKRYTTEVVANDMKMLSQRNESDGRSGAGGGYGDQLPGGDDVPF